MASWRDLGKNVNGWGDLLIPTRQVKILGMAGAVFQCLGD